MLLSDTAMPLMLGPWFEDTRSAAARVRSSLADWIEYRTIGLRGAGARWHSATIAAIDAARESAIFRALRTARDTHHDWREARRTRAALRPVPIWRQKLSDRAEDWNSALCELVEQARGKLALTFGDLRQGAASRAIDWADWWTLRVRYPIAASIAASLERVSERASRFPCIGSACSRAASWTPQQRRAVLSLTLASVMALPVAGAWWWSSSSVPGASEVELAQLAQLRTGTRGTRPTSFEDLPWLRARPRPDARPAGSKSTVPSAARFAIPGALPHR